MGPAYYVTRPLGEVVRDVLARGDDRAWMPQESRGAWSEERLAGWRTDPDVTAQLAQAALTSLDFSNYKLGANKSFGPGAGAKVKHMLSSYCFGCMHMYSVFIPLSVLTHAQCMTELPVCVCKYLRAYVHSFVNCTGKNESVVRREQSCASARAHAGLEDAQCCVGQGKIQTGLRSHPYTSLRAQTADEMKSV